MESYQGARNIRLHGPEYRAKCGSYTCMLSVKKQIAHCFSEKLVETYVKDNTLIHVVFYYLSQTKKSTQTLLLVGL